MKWYIDVDCTNPKKKQEGNEKHVGGNFINQEPKRAT